MDDSHAFRARSIQAIEGIRRIATVRFFQGHIHRLGLLALVEAAVVVAVVETVLLVGPPGATPAAHGLAAGAMLVALASMGLYELRQRAGLTGVFVRLLVAILMWEAALVAIGFAVPSLFTGLAVVPLIGLFSFIGLAIVRSVFVRLVDDDIFKLRVLVWGAGRRAATIATQLRRRADRRGFKVLGYIPSPNDSVQVPAAELVEDDGDLLGYALRHRVDEIVEAMDDRRQGFPKAFLLNCRLRGIAVRDIVGFLERESGRVRVDITHPSWLIYSQGFHTDLVRLVLKRAFDVSVALVVLLLSLPLVLLTAVAIRLEDRGPVFYSQERIGLNGRSFKIFKFRSMSPDAEADGVAVWARHADPRVTRVGAVIRKLRIDELPQAWNVLVGDMSFVGPRPERPAFVESLSRTIPFYRERHYVKPGITGWAQVRYPYGASESDAREKLGYDLYYIAHHNLMFDLKVLLETVEVVLLRIGSR